MHAQPKHYTLVQKISQKICSLEVRRPFRSQTSNQQLNQNTKTTPQINNQTPLA